MLTRKVVLKALLFLAVCLTPASYAAPPQASPTFLTSSRNDYTTTNVTTGAWVQLVSALGTEVDVIEIFDTCGQTLKLGFGPSGSEVSKLLVYPGGNGRVEIKIPDRTRVSIRAVSADCTVGENSINYYYY